MKTVIVTGYKGSFPFIDELVENVHKSGVAVEVLDICDMYTVRFAGGKTLTHHVKSGFLRKVFAVRKFGTLLKIFYYKRYLRNYLDDVTHVNIHYAIPYYSYFIDVFKKLNIRTTAVIWGSDFYRASSGALKQNSNLFDYCDDIIIGNPVMAADFVKHYSKYASKIRHVGFGIRKLDLIRDLNVCDNFRKIKDEMQIPNDKLIITLGYNGLKAQQHLLVLNAISSLPEEIRRSIFLVVPFGYGGDPAYKKEIEDQIAVANIAFKIFDSFISDVEVAKIRVCTDIAINAQITDAFSASIQEHMYAGNVLLVGDWLPYNHFKKIGVIFWTFNVDNIKEKLLEVLTSFSDYKKDSSGNSSIIYNLSSWEARTPQWVDILEK